jgi:hypothetical protein
MLENPELYMTKNIPVAGTAVKFDVDQITFGES